MKNWGQLPRAVKIKKRYTLSPYVLNLTEEGRQWAVLNKAMRKKIRRYGVQIIGAGVNDYSQLVT